MMNWLLDSEQRLRSNLAADLEEIKDLPTEQYTVKRIGKQLYLYRKKKDPSKNSYGYRYLGNVKRLDSQFINNIARKEVLEVRIKETKNRLHAIEKLRRSVKNIDYKKIYDKYRTDDYFAFELQNTSRGKMLQNYWGEEDRVLEWIANDIPQSFREEELKHMTPNGIKVRSKSELLIATALEERNLAFKYESEFKINGEIIFRPDFVIIRPYDMKEIYWEHFGLMGDQEYEAKTMKKLIYYQEKGWCLWDNLIISFDSDKGSFNMQTINKMIDIFLFAG